VELESKNLKPQSLLVADWWGETESNCAFSFLMWPDSKRSAGLEWNRTALLTVIWTLLLEVGGV